MLGEEGVWAKQARSWGELDAPLRRRLGDFWGMGDGGKASHDGGHMRNGGSRVLARRPQPQPVVDGDTAAVAAAAATAASRACLNFRVRWGEYVMV